MPSLDYHDEYSVPCECVKELRTWLEQHGMTVYSEDGQEPRGWVNVTCSVSGHNTFEGLLQPYGEEDD